MPVEVSLRGVCKSFASPQGRVPVLDRIDMTVRAGSFVSIVGPSGSGKSTLLAILAGLEEADRGEVVLLPQGSAEPLARRLGNVGYMPQRDLLLPWRNALDNATVGLEVQGVPRKEAQARALPLFEQFGLGGFAGSYPHALSGGMRQRVSFLRSALTARGLMLLDEPFGALDALTRATMQEWLLATAPRLGATYVLVTHDVDEAVLLSHRVYALSARPAHVAVAVDIDLPWPRTLDAANDPRFLACRKRLLGVLRSSGALREQTAMESVG